MYRERDISNRELLYGYAVIAHNKGKKLYETSPSRKYDFNLYSDMASPSEEIKINNFTPRGLKGINPEFDLTLPGLQIMEGSSKSKKSKKEFGKSGLKIHRRVVDVDEEDEEYFKKKYDIDYLKEKPKKEKYYKHEGDKANDPNQNFEQFNFF